MKPNDLDDPTPLEPDDDLLARVHVRSGSFRRRRRAQRLTSVVSGVLVVVLAVGIALTRVDTNNGKVNRPAPSATSTTTVPDSSADALVGKWLPVSMAGYDGPLTDPPLPWIPRLTFTRDGKWSGSDGCNDLSGSYQLGDNGSFHISDYMQTLVGCRQQLPTAKALGATARVKVLNDRLTFLAADGHELAQFERERVTARVVLPSDTLTAGSSMSGHVVVENDSGKALHAEGCGSLFQVALGNAEVQPGVGWDDCLQQFTIPIGESSYPVTVSGNYSWCGGDASTGHFPGCRPNGGLPPLPPGEYQAMLFQRDNAVPTPPPITVRVVPQQ